jgi:hypothetical protein
MSTAFWSTDPSVREDLLDILTNLTPTDTQLTTGLGVSSAKSRRHEWLTDTLSAVKTNAYAEGVDASYPTLTNPVRLLNYTQIFRQAYRVSDTERAVNHAAFNDRFAYEGIKALKMLKNDMEFAAMRGSLACSVADTTVGQLRGIKNWLSIVTAQSGVSFTEAILNSYLQNVWDNGVEVDAVYCGMRQKRKISGFTAGTTKFTKVEDKRLINMVDVYEADAARVVKLFAHRHVTIAGDQGFDIVGLREDLWRIAYLRRPFERELAKTGDATRGEVVSEATLECLHQYGGFVGREHD